MLLDKGGAAAALVKRAMEGGIPPSDTRRHARSPAAAPKVVLEDASAAEGGDAGARTSAAAEAAEAAEAGAGASNSTATSTSIPSSSPSSSLPGFVTPATPTDTDAPSAVFAVPDGSAAAAATALVEFALVSLAGNAGGGCGGSSSGSGSGGGAGQCGRSTRRRMEVKSASPATSTRMAARGWGMAACIDAASAAAVLQPRATSRMHEAMSMSVAPCAPVSGRGGASKSS